MTAVGGVDSALHHIVPQQDSGNIYFALFTARNKKRYRKSVPFFMLKFADYLVALLPVFLLGNDSRGERVFKGF